MSAPTAPIRPTIRLKPKAQPRAIRHGFPWAYDNEIVTDRRTKALAPGTIARLEDDEQRPLGAVALGSEALLLMRAEKGFIIAGKDTDGTTMPHDLGITAPRDRRKGEFVGKRSLFTDNALRDDRQQGVGLVAVDENVPLPVGAHGVATRDGVRRSIGFVTSSYMSQTLGRPIALALIERGLSRIGETIELIHLGRTMRATIAPACAFDPEGARING